MWDGPEIEPPLILGAAHKLSAAEEILDLSVKALNRSSGRKYVEHRSNVNGNKYFELSNGARYRCEAASDDGGRGLSVTDLAFDELRQQYDWASWSALTNTTNARFSAQVIAVSNAGTARATVLRTLRKRAIDRIDQWDLLVNHGTMTSEEYAATYDTTLGLFEWSAADGSGIWDRDGWAQANPSLGIPDENGVVYLTEETLSSKASLVGEHGDEGIPEHVFRTENLCQFVTADVESVFGAGVWDDSLDNDSSVADESELVLSVDVSHNREMGYISVAGYRPDGSPHVEVIAMRAGPEWIVPFFKENFATIGAKNVVIQGRGAPASSLYDHLIAEDIPVTKCEGTDLGSAHGRFYDAVRSKRVFHIEQPVLDLAAAEGQMRALGEVSVWDRGKSPVDVSPLIACAQALWGLEVATLRKKDSGVSYYESRGAVVV